MGPDTGGGCSLMAGKVQRDRDRDRAHAHAWLTRSSHHTLDGFVRYQRCECGRWQVTLAAEAAAEIGATHRAHETR